MIIDSGLSDRQAIIVFAPDLKVGVSVTMRFSTWSPGNIILGFNP